MIEDLHSVIADLRQRLARAEALFRERDGQLSRAQQALTAERMARDTPWEAMWREHDRLLVRERERSRRATAALRALFDVVTAEALRVV